MLIRLMHCMQPVMGELLIALPWKEKFPGPIAPQRPG